MSHSQTILQLIETLERGDVDGFRSHLAEDVRWEYHPTGNTAQDRDVPYMRYREGRDAAAGFLSDIDEDFELHSIDVKGILEGDGQVAVLFGYELTVRKTGKTIRDEEVHLYELNSDGEVTAFRHFLDTEKAIAAHT